MGAPAILIHYHEIWLKGCNRSFFVQKLKEAITRAVEGLGDLKAEHDNNRMIVAAPNQRVAEEAVTRLQKVPGIAYLALAEQVEPTLEAIAENGARMTLAKEFRTFRVRAKRSTKSIPFRSMDAERRLGARINELGAQSGRSIKVDLGNADVTCFVEVTPQRALLYTEKIPGVGGLPTGTAGKLVCLLSGGYDSAVAAYKIIKRGVTLIFVHFYGMPARPGEDSPPIARELVRLLTQYQGRSRLYLTPFTPVQREVVAGAPEAFRILIYRRMMLRIAEKMARRHHAYGLVTGDSIAQVASQTLQNMEAVSAAASLPIYRPVIGDDKQEILTLSRTIGAYEISSEPFTDCCPMFLPKSPKIFSRIADVDAAESRLDIDGLVRRAVAESEREIYEFRNGAVRQTVLNKDEAHQGKVPVAAG